MKRKALKRSFDVYYRDRDRTTRMDQLNAQFVRPGGLAFDIGAHVGDRTASFRRLGARVVAVEPQPYLFRALRLIHGRDASIALVCAAVGAETGRTTLHINSSNPTVSTVSTDLIRRAPQFEAWKDQTWDQSVEVDTLTLDGLIATHGLPDFIKIDVEGHELDTLNGLTQPAPKLSFEFTTLQRDVAASCLTRLQRSGFLAFNASLGENHRLVQDHWMSFEEVVSFLAALPDSANSGDIYALRDMR